MSFGLLSYPEIEGTIQTAVSCAAWLWRRDDGLAIQMRDEFMREWEVEPWRWNESCDRLIGYAIRKGDGIAPQAPFEAVRI